MAKVFKEHNNRKIANQYAEYVTGEAFRQYVAGKVKQYVGDNPSVFDGAVGSGQLEWLVEPSHVYGVEIQSASCEVFKENYGDKAHVYNQSFFDFEGDVLADCVIMNPPFSLMFKDLSDHEKAVIQSEYPWKKSGKIDDIFVLKSLKHSKRYGFYILFPGVGYRGTERKFRELIGNQLAELNLVQNGFEDTSIDVLFIVIDKEKTGKTCQREIYDCKSGSQLLVDNWEIDTDNWEQPRIEVEKEVIDIDFVNQELDRIVLDRLQNHLEAQLLVIRNFGADIDYLGFISKAYDILANYEVQYNLGGKL